MRPLLLHLDEALRRQPQLLQAARAHRAAEILAHDLGPALRLWSRPPALDALRRRLRARLGAGGPLLTFLGSGDFHHVSALLVERAIEVCDTRLTVVHFDNHPDWVRFGAGMHCGSWVARAARLPGVARVITVGVCSRDILRPRSRGADLALLDEGRVEVYPYRMPDGAISLRLRGREWPSIESMGEAAFAELLLGRIATRDIYVTIDKDVLRGEDAVTNWDQGRASAEFVGGLVRRLRENHALAGADVTGDWSPPVYADGSQRWLKRAEAFIDQPWRRPGTDALLVNEQVNLQLLRHFGAAA